MTQNDAPRAHPATQTRRGPFSLVGERALITGGGSGLGLGMAQCMAQAGAEVVLVGRRENTLTEAVQTIGDAASYQVCDITDTEAVASMVERAQQAGPISILVNNAGVHLKKDAVDTEPDEFQAVLQTHVLAAFDLTRRVLPGMIERKHGSILFIASMASLLGIPKVIAYSAAKSAYTGMVRALTAEAAPHNVRVNAIAPGWIESPMLRQALAGDEARTNKILGRTPMGRFGEARDIGNTAVYLCSDAARFVTGTVLPVDGGASIGF